MFARGAINAKEPSVTSVAMSTVTEVDPAGMTATP